MKKTSDEELNKWRYQYPSTAVSWDFKGDKVKGHEFIGAAKLLLYQVKNRMRLSAALGPPYGLKSLRAVRHYNDGTVIIAKSTYGQDFIEIFAVSGGAPSCSITLINIPEVVQPMRYPGFIGQGRIVNVGEDPWGMYDSRFVPLEVEGVDYIKTYYTISKSDCDVCPENSTLCLPGVLVDYVANVMGLGPGEPAPNPPPNAFTFKDKTGLLPYKDQATYGSVDDLDDHCVYGNCQAEIIKWGSDAQGTYFLWKAYTEWSTWGPYVVTFTRTGMGHLLLRNFINDPNNVTKALCEAQSIVKVDCCQKPSSARRMVMLWENEGQRCAWQPSLVHKGIPLCEVPYTMSDWYLWNATNVGGGTLLVFPELYGGCTPYEWKLEGPGYLRTWVEETQYTATYFPARQGWMVGWPEFTNFIPGQTCNTVTITVNDQCGNADQIIAGCCEWNRYLAELGGEVEEKAISYTSLQVPCDHTDNFQFTGACNPVTWVLSGGGSIEVMGDYSVNYTAPASNEGCLNNGTLTATDCCGDSAVIQIAVNCYAGADVSMQYCDGKLCGHDCQEDGPYCGLHAVYEHLHYDCDGDVIFSEFWSALAQYEGSFVCPDDSYFTCGAIPDCTDSALGHIPCGWATNCGAGSVCGVLVDMRSAALKAAGCCPINPLTGLPF